MWERSSRVVIPVSAHADSQSDIVCARAEMEPPPSSSSAEGEMLLREAERPFSVQSCHSANNSFRNRQHGHGHLHQAQQPGRHSHPHAHHHYRHHHR